MKRLLLILLGITSIYLFAVYPFKKTHLSLNHLKQERKMIHENALAQIKKAFAIPEDIWKSQMELLEQMIKNDELMGVSKSKNNRSGSPLKTIITKILVEFGINPDKVHIQELITQDGMAFAFQSFDSNNRVIHSIEVNPQWLKQFNVETQKAIIRHEVMHLVHYDCIEEHFVKTILHLIGLESEYYDTHPAIIHYRQQREMRADLLGVCDCKKSAHALCNHYQEYKKRYDQHDPKQWLTHPSHITRIEQLAQLMKTMDTLPEVAIA